MPNVIFIAPPAAGKGTISKYLVDNFSYIQLSTGDLLRNTAKENTDLGKNIAHLIHNGIFVSDEIVLQLIQNELEKIQGQPFILDGIPRNLLQAKHLEKIFQKLQITNYIVIDILLEEDLLKKRATGRRICPSCHVSYNVYFDAFKPLEEGICNLCESMLIAREDDKEEVFMNRYQTYLENTLPLLDFYEKQGLLYKINANVDKEDILEQVRQIVHGEKHD